MILSLVIKHDCTHIDTPPQKTYRYLPREKNCGITYKGQIMTKIVLTVGIPKHFTFLSYYYLDESTLHSF